MDVKIQAAIDRVLATALAEEGYIEKASNSQLDDKTANPGKGNWTKYAAALDGMGQIYNGRKNGYDWCDVFVDWVFITTFGTELGMKLLCQSYKGLGAGVKWSANYYKTKGQFYESNPQPGDQIFFGDATSWWHTGLVVKVDNKYVYTIEGNTTSAAGVVANGGCVAQKRYLLTYKNIKGFGRPDWTLAVDAQEMSTTAVPGTGVEMEDEDMTQEKFNEMMDNYLAGLAAKEGSSWSEEARQFCIDNGLFIGGNPDENGDPTYMWRSYMTREALAQVMMRLANMMGLK